MNKLELPKSKQEITLNKAIGDFQRHESIQNALNHIIKAVMYVAPIVAIIWFGLILYHNYHTGNWDFIQSSGLNFIGVVVAYIVGSLNRNISK